MSGVELPVLDRGSGPVLLLLHAVGDSHRAFFPLLEHLPLDRRLLAPDQRGHGGASKLESGYAVSDFVADAVGLLDALDLERAALVGASSGGLVAQRLAADHPERVSNLVLVGAPHSLQDVTLPESLSTLTDPLDPALLRSFTNGLTAQPLDAALVEAAVSEGLRAPAHVWSATLAGLVAEPPPSRRAPITAPTLLLWGMQDKVLDYAQQEALLQDIPGSRLVALPGIGHLPIWECPERVAAEITTFLGSISP